MPPKDKKIPPKDKKVPPELLIANYQSLMALITGDATLIWNRFNAMLTANAIIAAVLGAVTASNGLDKRIAWLLLLSSIFGLALCRIWWTLTHRGWALQHKWVSAAQKFDWKSLQSPFDPYTEWCHEHKCGTGTNDWICRSAKHVICLFVFAYIALIPLGIYLLLKH